MDVTTARSSFTLAIDGTTKLPTRVVSMTDNLNLGDVAMETAFADYQDVGGLKLPARLTTTTDRVMTTDIRAAKQTVDADTGDLAAPRRRHRPRQSSAPPPAKVTVQEVAKGIWWLAGQSHHSVLVEFADHLTLIEAPQNDTRTLAVIAKARELRPNKPLTNVVVTPSSFRSLGRHSCGRVRRARRHRAQGQRRVLPEAPRPARTQSCPTRWPGIPKPLKIETVDEELVLKDATMTVNCTTSPEIRTPTRC